MERRHGLSIRSRRDARAFAEAFFSRDGDPVPGERLDDFELELSDFFFRVRGRARLLFLACLATATWGAPLLVGRPFARLAALTVGERIAALEAMEQMPVAQLALFATKAVTSIVYYEHPDARLEMGWDARCLGKKALPVLATSAAELEA